MDARQRNLSQAENRTGAVILQRRARMPIKRRSKYGAVKTTVDGIVFHSAKEASRYRELQLLVKAGEIGSLTLQPVFLLLVETPKHNDVKLGEYRGDFQYQVTSEQFGKFLEWVIEDVKGFKTPLYRWKKKHMEAQYGIQIREI